PRVNFHSLLKRSKSVTCYLSPPLPARRDLITGHESIPPSTWANAPAIASSESGRCTRRPDIGLLDLAQLEATSSPRYRKARRLSGSHPVLFERPHREELRANAPWHVRCLDRPHGR